MYNRKIYRFYINNIDNDYHYGELVREFMPDDDFEVIAVDMSGMDGVKLGENSYIVNSQASADRDEIKRELYRLLGDIKGHCTDWGTLTGVRPLKLALGMYEKSGNSAEYMKEHMKKDYLVSDNKISLLTEIADYQIAHLEGNPSDRAGLYIGIPFCPTRCEYCAFASNVAGDDEIAAYLDNLIREIDYMGSLVHEHGTKIESIYIGGGTPTTLSAPQLRRLIAAVKRNFCRDGKDIEFTVEAGRPDTITEDKIGVLVDEGISRISINPQTMKDETLQRIGRLHSADDIRKAYELTAGHFLVTNADLIAGLPGEDENDFRASLDEIINLGANNITVHTLSVKRGSRLREHDPEYYRRNTETVSAMLDYAHGRLTGLRYYPYYIYRQKHQMGSLENVGYCLEGMHSVYNIRIMEEKQTIIALGAGAIGKVYYPAEDRLERIANVSNYQIYSERFDEMLERKKQYYQ